MYFAMNADIYRRAFYTYIKYSVISCNKCMKLKRNFDILRMKCVTPRTIVQNQTNSLKTKVTTSPQKP